MSTFDLLTVLGACFAGSGAVTLAAISLFSWLERADRTKDLERRLRKAEITMSRYEAGLALLEARLDDDQALRFQTGTTTEAAWTVS